MLYRFESNVRSASVVGMVGAGGIGVVLLGVETAPAAFGMGDAEPRVQAALYSARGRNFIGAN